jgi:hypothetical protein
MNYQTIGIIRAISTGFNVFFCKTTEFHCTPGSSDIPRSVIITRLTALADMGDIRTACTAKRTATPNHFKRRCVHIPVYHMQLLKMTEHKGIVPF